MLDNKNKIERMVESMGEGVIMTDEKGELIMLNQMARQALGFNSDEEVTIGDLVKYIVNEDGREFFSKEMNSNEYTQVEMKIIKPYPHFLSAIQTSVKDERGEKIGIVTILRDITKQREIDELKSDFISMVSHEFIFPLATIKNVVEILLERKAGGITDVQNHLLDIANKNIDRLTFLISDLLDISKIESGQLKMELALVDINEVIEDVIVTLEHKAREKNILITANLTKGVPKIYGDYQRMVQIFMNIIENAIKFTDKGSVTVTSREENGYARVSVSNTGPGIPPESINKIFDKFYQVRESAKDSSKGVGLGLTIAQKIVEMHHGKIEVESEPGKGSTFHVLLPFANKNTEAI